MLAEVYITIPTWILVVLLLVVVEIVWLYLIKKIIDFMAEWANGVVLRHYSRRLGIPVDELKCRWDGIEERVSDLQDYSRYLTKRDKGSAR